MKLQVSTNRFRNILSIVLGIVFVLTLGVIIFATISSNTESRSRAAETISIYKSWDFTKNEEGWKGQNLNGLVPRDGILYATIGPKQGSLINSTVNTRMPAGNKYISISMAVVTQGPPIALGVTTECVISSDGTEVCLPGNNNQTPGFIGGSDPSGGRPGGGGTYIPPVIEPCVPKPTCPAGKPKCAETFLYPAGGWCPPGVSPVPTRRPTITPKSTLKPTPKSESFSFNLYYWTSGEDLAKLPKSKPITLKGAVDGKMATYYGSETRLESLSAVTITQIKIVFTSGVKPGDRVQFDQIALIGPLVRPTPSCVMPPSCASNTPPCSYAVKGVMYCPLPSINKPTWVQNTPTRVPQPTVIEVTRCWNKVITMNGRYYWPNGCRGIIRPGMACTLSLVGLTESEIAQYKIWIDSGRKIPSGCQ